MGFEEGKPGRAHFPKDRPVAFKCFLEWFYPDDASVLSEKDSIMEQIKLYCLASQYRGTALMNRLMDRFTIPLGESASS